ncbi:MAG: glycerophosphodiester phosphodiesterase [Deltaproteobacteria bacterium HGW-Deltaproteobacteria-14]|jgi:glycerophosphoryl diester phosphodiesterase|nr:MAG: glycerophosphodiester phosphodiesterase [Deltaproteobacteria bacterium HGW-Deltaproteobacteria-14]
MTLDFIAHRGDSARFPENTLCAFSGAIDAGADGVECDVRLDRAGRPRVFHDDDTLRLTGVPGGFADHPPERLDALRVSAEPIPDLAAVAALLRAAAAVRPLTWNVEFKPTSHAAAVVAACLPTLAPLAAAGVTVVVSSFDPRVIAALQHSATSFKIALLYDDLLALRALRWLPRADALDLHPRHDLVDAPHVAEYGRPGRAFRCWTVDEPAEALRLAALGVAAVVTNRPGPLRAACAAQRQASSAP